MTIQDFISDLQAAGTIVAQGVTTLEALDPAVVPEADVAKVMFSVTSQLLTAALTAWSNASGQPITVATVSAFLPNPTPLSAPTS